MRPVEIRSNHVSAGSDDFWDRYVAHVQAQGVPPAVVRWYVIRTEHSIRAVAHAQLAEHTPQDVTQYGPKPTLKP